MADVILSQGKFEGASVRELSAADLKVHFRLSPCGSKDRLAIASELRRRGREWLLTRIPHGRSDVKVFHR